MFGEALATAQTAVDQFINISKSGNVEKIVIDLQQNTGGEVLLAFDVFKRFFPNIDPYGASRMRAHHAADVMGDSLTNYYAGLSTSSPDYEALAADEWIATPRINAETDVNFTSWAEFYGSYEYNGDNFTTKVSPLMLMTPLSRAAHSSFVKPRIFAHTDSLDVLATLQPFQRSLHFKRNW